MRAKSKQFTCQCELRYVCLYDADYVEEHDDCAQVELKHQTGSAGRANIRRHPIDANLCTGVGCDPNHVASGVQRSLSPP